MSSSLDFYFYFLTSLSFIDPCAELLGPARHLVQEKQIKQSKREVGQKKSWDSSGAIQQTHHWNKISGFWDDYYKTAKK